VVIPDEVLLDGSDTMLPLGLTLICTADVSTSDAVIAEAGVLLSDEFIDVPCLVESRGNTAEIRVSELLV
jgi:hypothetical protein